MIKKGIGAKSKSFSRKALQEAYERAETQTNGDANVMENRLEQNEDGPHSSDSSWMPDVVSSALTAIFLGAIPTFTLASRLGSIGIGPAWLEEVGRSALFTSAAIALFFMVWGINLYQSDTKLSARLWFCSPIWLPITFVGFIAWILVVSNLVT